MTLVATAGHLHPGGLYTDLKVTRGGRTGALFRSEAKYFEPAGAVSWDVSMTVHQAGLARRAASPATRSTCSATYDTRKASWYESMGISVVFFADGDPARRRRPVRATSTGTGCSRTATCRRTTTTAAARSASPTRGTLLGRAERWTAS